MSAASLLSYRLLCPLLLCLWCLPGCKSKTEAKADNLLRTDPSAGAPIVGASKTVHEVGELASARDYSLKVLGVKTCTLAPPFAPPPGIEKLGIHVELVGLSGKQVPVNPFYAQVENAKGRRFEATLAGCQPALAAQQISQGQTARGWISFDLPAQQARQLTFTYSPVVIGVGREEVRFEVDG